MNRFLAMLLVCVGGFWPLGSYGFELVQSTPVETKLGLVELKSATDTWLSLAKNAKKSIDLEQFYISNTPAEVLEPILKEIEAAAARGVKVRALFSDAMQDSDPVSLKRLRDNPKIEVRIVSYREITGGIQHAKFWIVDEKIGFVGSQNLDWKALKHIQELGILFEDLELVSQLKQVFEIDWEIARTGKAPNPPAEPVACHEGIGPAKLVANPKELNPPCVDWSLVDLLTLIQGAKDSLAIQLLTYSTKGSGKEGGKWLEIDNALRAAAKRGVKVKLLVADWNIRNPDYDALKDLDQVDNVEVKAATIPTHSSGVIPYARVIHSKFMVVDGKTLWIGTSNWSRGYFYATRGIEIILKKPELANQAATLHQQLWDSAYTKSVTNFPKP